MAYPVRRPGHWLSALAAVLALTDGRSALAQTPNVTFSTVATNGYSAGDINSVAISRYNLITRGDYQYATFYDSDRYINVSRRTVTPGGTPTAWQTRKLDDPLYRLPTSGATAISDDHNIISMGIDGNGYMYVSWGMHNNTLSMARSVGVVDSGWGTGSLAFNKYSSVTGVNESSVTYPEFYNVAGKKDLLFFYRDGGSGGGSGNGNEYINYYDATANAWSKVSGGNPLINGISGSYNGYLNSAAYDSKGEKLHISWTWRESSDFQTNHDIMHSVSPDNGKTWLKADGSYSAAPFTRTITNGVTTTNAPLARGGLGDGTNAGGASLINQSSMALDADDRPMIATWYAPGYKSGNHTRQYMLEWFDGSTWKSSQITSRAANMAKVGNDATTIRRMARPIVLVDDDNRVIVIMRANNLGAPGISEAAQNNGIVAGYSTDRVNWSFVTLSSIDMGQYEPTYDAALWKDQNKLNLFFQPIGGGVGSGTVRVLEWDAVAYFDALPEPASAGVVAMLATMTLIRRARSHRGQ